jgi:hypothetical protein
LATVITSLATTIPVIGKQVVYWLWGGLKEAYYCCETINKTLLDAGKGYFIEKKVYYYVMNLRFQNNVKRYYMITQSAGLTAFLAKLNPLGCYGGSRLDQTVALSCRQVHNCVIPVIAAEKQLQVNSQRLNAEDLKWLVGFVEGDGCFSVNKNGKFFKCEFSIELSLVDIQLLYKIKAMLKSYGSISVRKRGGLSFARFKISSKPILKEVICPIFEQFPMITSKYNDFTHFRNSLFSNFVHYDQLPKYVRSDRLPLNNVDAILALPYFDSWLVGFIEAEGCFSTYASSKEKYLTFAFNIAQKDGLQLMQAIKKRLSFATNPYYNKTTDVYSIYTSSTRGISNVISFLKKAPTKLKGNKKAQYLKWLHKIIVNPKYSNVALNSSYFY